MESNFSLKKICNYMFEPLTRNLFYDILIKHILSSLYPHRITDALQIYLGH